MDDILTYVREKISCPQFGDDHYGEWGALPLTQRKTIKRLLDYSFSQEEVINHEKARVEVLKKTLQKVCEEIAETKVLVAKDIEKAKIEAIKEFAERLKQYLLLTKNGQMSVISFENIDYLVKEMVGDSK